MTFSARLILLRVVMELVWILMEEERRRGDFSFLRCDEEVGGRGGGDFSFLWCDEEVGGGGRRRLLFYMGD